MGDTFTVKADDEPPPETPQKAPPKAPKRRRNYNIKVVHDTLTDEYTASWGTRMPGYTGPSLATALRLLANAIDALRLHGSDREHLAELRRKPDVLCKYCDAPIFFAKLPPPSIKMLAFDVAPAEAADLKDIRVATIAIDGWNKPVVAWPSKPEGPVWLPHPECCGAKSLAPENATLKERWLRTRANSAQKRDEVIAGLRAISRDLTKGVQS